MRHRNVHRRHTPLNLTLRPPHSTKNTNRTISRLSHTQPNSPQSRNRYRILRRRPRQNINEYTLNLPRRPNTKPIPHTHRQTRRLNRLTNKILKRVLIHLITMDHRHINRHNIKFQRRIKIRTHRISNVNLRRPTVRHIYHISPRPLHRPHVTYHISTRIRSHPQPTPFQIRHQKPRPSRPTHYHSRPIRVTPYRRPPQRSTTRHHNQSHGTTQRQRIRTSRPLRTLNTPTIVNHHSKNQKHSLSSQENITKLIRSNPSPGHLRTRTTDTGTNEQSTTKAQQSTPIHSIEPPSPPEPRHNH